MSERTQPNHFRNAQGPDEIQLKRVLLTVGLMAGVVFASYLALKKGQPELMLLVTVLPIAIWIFVRPSVAIALAWVVSYGLVKVPGLPGSVMMGHLLQLVVIANGLLNMAVRRKGLGKKQGSDICIGFFLLIMFLTMSVRGFGIRLFGGAEYGGTRIVFVIIAILFYIFSRPLTLDKRQIKLLLFGSVIAGAILLTGQISMILFGQKANFFHFFMKVGTAAYQEIAGSGDVSGSRLTNASYLGRAAVMLGLAYSFRRKIWTFLITGLGFLAILMSGFRGTLVSASILLFAWSMWRSKSKLRTIFLWGGAAFLIWISAIVAVDSFPTAMQRTVSFLPFVNAPPEVERQALTSITWRFEVWDICRQNMGQYLFIGRGRSEDVTAWSWLQGNAYMSPEFFYHMHNYHNGFYELMLDWGVFGFLSVAGFMWFGLIETWRGYRRFSNKEGLAARTYLYLAMYFTYGCVSFFLIYGDVPDILTRMLAFLVILRCIRNQVEKEQASAGKMSDASTFSLTATS